MGSLFEEQEKLKNAIISEYISRLALVLTKSLNRGYPIKKLNQIQEKKEKASFRMDNLDISKKDSRILVAASDTHVDLINLKSLIEKLEHNKQAFIVKFWEIIRQHFSNQNIKI